MIEAEISIENEVIVLQSNSPSERYAIKAFIEKHARKKLEDMVHLYQPPPDPLEENGD